MPKPDPSQFPLIRDILKHYPPPTTNPTSWLTHPPIQEAIRDIMPAGYTDEIHISTTGHLLVWGTPKGHWDKCLTVQGMNWTTVGSDLVGLFETHESDGIVVLGSEKEFMALVFMRSVEAQEGAIGDLDGAVIGCDEPLRVCVATGKDLQKALELQKVGLRGV